MFGGSAIAQTSSKNYRRWLAIFLKLFFPLIISASPCFASNQNEGISISYDRIFGVKCNLEMCRTSQGFLLGPKERAFAVHFTKDGKGWIVGDDGLAMKTEDKGANWQTYTIWWM